MRLLKRNLRTIKYSLYQGKTAVVEDTQDAWETGETAVTYSQPVALECNVSPAMGRTAIEMFGDLQNYEKVIVTADMSCPINEQSILFVDVSGEVVDGKYVYDYIVRRVARSLNYIAYAISKAETGPYGGFTQYVRAVDGNYVYAVALPENETNQQEDDGE